MDESPLSGNSTPPGPNGPHWDAMQDKEDVLFGPGIKLTQELREPAQLDLVVTQVHDLGLEADDGREANELDSRAFVELEQPVYSSTPVTKASGAAKPRATKTPAVTAQRPKSARQAANKSGIPVAKRAQHRLVKELQFVSSSETVDDKALSEYLKLYKSPLPQKAIDAIRKAIRLSHKPMARALAAVAQDEPATAA